MLRLKVFLIEYQYQCSCPVDIRWSPAWHGSLHNIIGSRSLAPLHTKPQIIQKISWLFQIIGYNKNVPHIEDLCNGSTPDSDSVCGGSNPSSSAIKTRYPSGYLVFVLGWDSNPSKCDMPVAYRCHQFKNWWLPWFFPVFTGKNVIESLIRFPPESWGFFFHSPLLKFGFFQIFKGGFLVSLRFSLTRWRIG